MSATIEITLTQGKTVLIDADDSEFSEYAWQYDQHTGYAKRKFNINGKRVTKYLHRMIFEKHNSVELLKSELVDHENNNRLDCTTKNLRLADYSQNAANKQFRGSKSGYKWVIECGIKFQGKITWKSVVYTSDKFDSAEVAFNWSITKASELQGDFVKV